MLWIGTAFATAFVRAGLTPPLDGSRPGAVSRTSQEGSPAVYAIVRSGGRQHKVAVGDVLEVNRLTGERGSTVTLPPVLVIDGGEVTSDPAALARYKISAEIVDQTQGPKIDILRFKNKTGYRRRLGHRQQLTQVKVTSIDSE